MDRIKDHLHELSYRERKQVEDNLAWKENDRLIKEFKEAQDALDKHPTWSAAISSLLEWKHELEREILRRGLTVA